VTVVAHLKAHAPGVLATRPGEVVDELVHVVVVEVRPFGRVAESRKAGDPDARDPPGDRRRQGDTGDLQFRDYVACVREFRPERVEEVVVAGPELVDHRG